MQSVVLDIQANSAVIQLKPSRCTDLQGTMEYCIEYHSNDIRVYRSIEN